MMQTTLKTLRVLVGLALMVGGSYVLVKGGISHNPPLHMNWGCTGLAFAMLLPGAFLFRPSLFLSRVSNRR